MRMVGGDPDIDGWTVDVGWHNADSGGGRAMMAGDGDDDGDGDGCPQ